MHIYIHICIYKHASTITFLMRKENDIFHEYVYLNCNVFENGPIFICIYV